MANRRLTRRRLLQLAGAAGASAVAGKVWLDTRPLPANAVSIAVEGPDRVVRSNGVPDHATGAFPNPDCPLRLRPQKHVYRMPASPAVADALRPLGFWEFGVALNGIPLDPAGPHFQGDATSGWQFEVLSPVARPRLGIDDALAHVQPGGAYHYHGLSPMLLRRGPGLLGWAADGFPVLAPLAPSDPLDPASPLVLMKPSYRLRVGRRKTLPGGVHDGTFVEDYELVPGLGHLDEANGRVGLVPGFDRPIYHYFLTEAFPFIPRFHRGTPDPSFGRHSGGPGLAGVPPALRAYRAT
ncbi:MAG TPA: YHYH protein [Planctomycetota bacterium]|nr:YHYH protein [Planctomycetota bacterium]